jgi:hypothetical protein
MITFADDYSKILDKWREAEAPYEEKTDPPEWNWQIISLFEHISAYLWFASAICSDFQQLEYIAQYIQIFATTCQLYNCTISYSKSNMIHAILSCISIVCMILYQHYRNSFLLLSGTALEVASHVSNLVV